jgi:hypothetical protein
MIFKLRSGSRVQMDFQDWRIIRQTWGEIKRIHSKTRYSIEGKMLIWKRSRNPVRKGIWKRSKKDEF